MSKTAWIIVVGVGALFVLAILASVFVPHVGGGHHGYSWGMGSWMMGPFMGGGAILMLLFWVLIIAGAIWLAQALAHGPASATSASSESSLEILKRRYARGEINKEQFDQMRRDLGV